MVPQQGSAWEVELPGGLIDASGRRLARAELRPLTGAEEDWVATHPGIPNAAAVTGVLNACLVRFDDSSVDRELVKRLLVGDRDYLMLQLRCITLGDQFRAVIHCPACSAKMDVDFAVHDIPIEPRPRASAMHTLERDGRTLQFRLPTGSDQEAVINLDLPDAIDALMGRCLIDDGGIPLTAEDRTAMIDAMDCLAPQVDVELNLTCPECGHGFVTPFDTTAFFLDEMRLNGKRLLHETHLLAFYYHWGEAEILRLGRNRRRAYLALLSDEIKRD
ncbi:MAG TPA: hypothetical protein VHR66_24835 [Gemmataceae bacterium]|jgi:hypothetical protein|nr:hypothetical protein [Gemmataceae bacterium]